MVLAASLAASASFATWNKIGQFTLPNTTQWVSAIFFINDQVGFIGVYGPFAGCIQRTTDGGNTWSFCATPTMTSALLFTDIWFRDSSEGWAAFVYGTTTNLWHTTDGGVTWLISGYAGPDVGAVRQTSKAVVATGKVYPGGVYVSVDDGNTFKQRGANDQLGLDFVDDLHGVASGFGYPFVVTGDGGLTWTTPGVNFTNEAFGVYGIQNTGTFVAIPEAVSTSSVKNVLTSTDNGATWTSSPYPPTDPTGDIKGFDNILFIQSRQNVTPGGLWRSTDLGSTWKNIGGPNNWEDTRFFVVDCGNVIFAADSAGGLWKSTDCGDGFMQVCNVAPDVFAMSSSPATCDSARLLHFFRNPKPGDSVAVLDMRIVDSTRPPTLSGAFGIDSIPQLPVTLGGQDSAGYILHWKPARETTPPGLDSATIRIIWFNKNKGIRDTSFVVAHLKTTAAILDTVNFLLHPPPTIRAGEHFAVGVYPDRSFITGGPTNISGVFRYLANDLLFDSVTTTASNTLQWQGPFADASGQVDRIDWSVSSASGITLDPRNPVAWIWLEPLLTDSANYFVDLDSMKMAIAGVLGSCGLTTAGFGTPLTFDPACKDSLLIELLRNQQFYFSAHPRPNPVTDGYAAAIAIQAAMTGTAHIEVFDLLGRTLTSDNIAIERGTRDYRLELSGEPAGKYSYLITFYPDAQGKGIVHARGSLLLLK